MDNHAVSEVVGEMLMLGMVILLIAVFSWTISAFVPVERSPTVTVILSNDTLGNITLWHKGGDWIPTSDLRVIVRTNSGGEEVFRAQDGDAPLVLVPMMPESQSNTSFGLGGNITVRWDAESNGNLTPDTTVSLATSRIVVFSGTLGGH